ncbi:MAG: GSCFA domain-containing protein [Methylovulum sp.]|nr:GSCFA domain-containing protein [Methylovulum sp.]
MINNALVIGHSHILCLRTAYKRRNKKNPTSVDFDFLLLRDKKFHSQSTLGLSDEERRTQTSSLAGVDRSLIKNHIEQTKPDTAILCINGNEHSGIGMIHSPSLTQAAKLDRMSRIINKKLTEWLNFLHPLLPGRVIFYPSPPPVDAHHLSGLFSEERVACYAGRDIEPIGFRLSAWLKYCEIVKNLCAQYNIEFIDLPASIFKNNGFRAEDCYSKDLLHGNTEYGLRVLTQLSEVIIKNSNKPTPVHPYQQLPDYAFWKQAITDQPCANVDPVTNPPFTIRNSDNIATAGSCFAQHISKHLRAQGFQFLVTEQPNNNEPEAEARGFYDFSARYGNIYTARQLLQLFDRAFGYFQPLDKVWERHDGGFCDPFRPRIEPQGFLTEAHVRQDVRQHLKAVKKLFLELDVLVFTLGLTECYLSRLDGAVYPLAPGVTGGKFDPAQHVFTNFTVSDVSADLRIFLQKLHLVNPNAKVILTVSPVPLVATAAQRHVLVSTTYSKAVLRVAAEEIAASHPQVCYFPAYEIITGNHAGHNYFNEDRRSVTAQGVEHVMRLFMAHMTEQAGPNSATENYTPEELAALTEMDELVETICDEELLAR